MTPDRKKPGVAFWATVVAVVVLIGYPLSIGPACWWFPGPTPPYGDTTSHFAHRMYWPAGWLAVHAPRSVGDAIFFYVGLGTTHEVLIPTKRDADVWYSTTARSIEKSRRAAKGR
jgi:hypothetical protein